MMTPRWVIPAFRLLIAIFTVVTIVFYTLAAPATFRALLSGEQPSIGAVLGSGPVFTNDRTIVALRPDGPLARAGAQVGDLVEIHGRWPRRDGIGSTQHVDITGGDGQRRSADIVLDAEPADLSRIIIWFSVVAAIPTLGLAVALAVRRADAFAERALAIAFAAYALFDVMDALPTETLRTIGIVEWLIGSASAYICYALFALYFLRPAEDRLRADERIFLTLQPVAAALQVVALAFERYSWNLPGWLDFYPAIYVQCVYLFIAIVLRRRWRASGGEARERLRWIGLAFATNWISDLIAWYPENTVPLNAATVLGAIVTIGVFAYAILRRRVFEFGFAVNRAAVFGVTSLVLVGLFAALTAITDRVLHIDDGVARNWSDIAITVGLAVAAARVRKLAEAWVERLLFRDLHAREAALRAFVRRSSHFETDPALLAALHDALAQFIGRNAVSIYRRAGADFYVAQIDDLGLGPSFAVDAPIAVELRSRGAAMRDGSGWVLPMQQGGRVDGFVVVGEKADREIYRPDEIELLANCVRQVGLDLQALRVTALERELAQQRGAPVAECA
ncbi:histidine kinase N-terminal 7TM domain-containing protein [Roseiterribacter gracilis]|uniref:Histidine kinase N-terminal 7TM region domain-containing protein n=1 Tax=Roseiterribacter gracilis TaxID=2812848 RepID=A0A8S8XFN2_9PROT|nr:hypothetical protein TMPK1_21170 [Rhodospirillales bacterium TMPK1]